MVVSNRLPISLSQVGGRLVPKPSAGGLAAALAGVHSDAAEGGFVWVGWPGCPVPRGQQQHVRQRLAAQGYAPVFLSAQQESRYYRGMCNEVLWPLFHYFTGLIKFTDSAWREYVDVNRRFADAVIEHSEPGARVWVHDFHLMLVPSMLRARRPDLAIGFFLHIPFPSSEIYRLLPVRDDLLRGLLGADYISFHIADYARHFRSACLRVLGLESEPWSLTYEGRRIGIGCDPIGVDVEAFRTTLQDPETAHFYGQLSERYRGRRLVLGVERLDYSKGIPLKLAAFERFLARNPQRAADTTLLQVLVPSRLDHPEYMEIKREIEETVGRINGQYGRPGITPVEYMHRAISPAQLAALYRFASVALVTPIRDGMNLIAQEFVLCQDAPAPMPAHNGILVLSEFAGAAHSLARAILVNPWSISDTADAIEAALRMPPEEKRDRVRAMASQVVEMDCRSWASGFLGQLDEVAATQLAARRCPRLSARDADALCARFANAKQRLLALDYDGTLCELQRRPQDASPTPEIRALLTDLAAQPNTSVHLISGRPQEVMQEWFGDLPVHLCAEHGYVARAPGGGWDRLHDVDLSWMDDVEEMLLNEAREVHGAMVERKGCALAWHYRMADADYGAWRARELLAALRDGLANEPVEVVAGNRVIEVRAQGVNKGSYLRRVIPRDTEGLLLLCAGDDRTDIDMFRALPAGAVSIHVGQGSAETTCALESPSALRALLRAMADCVIAAGR